MSGTNRPLPPPATATPAIGQNTEHHAMTLAAQDLAALLAPGTDPSLFAARFMVALLRHGFDVMPTDPARLSARVKGWLDRQGGRPPTP